VYKLSQYIGTLIVSCVSTTLTPNISETKPLGSSCPIGSLRESAYGASIGDVIDDVTWTSRDYDVILVTSQWR